MVQVGVESEDGWRPARLDAGSDQLVWIDVPGTTVSLQVMKGRPQALLGALAADFNAYIEPLRDPDSASYTPTNSVNTSNHLNGTAMDLNWGSHDFQVRGTFTAAQMTTIRQLLDFYEGWIFWAGDWDDPVDEMHWQLGYDTWTRTDAQWQDFAKRKLRSDGFSTFRRGTLPGDPVAPPPAVAPADDEGAATVLYDAVPIIDEARSAELLAPVRAGLIAAKCTTVNRIAMFLAQTGHESDGYQTTEEYADGSAYNNRPDLGNTQQGDGPRFKGRTWIQITGRANYTKFSAWAADQGLISDPAYFVNNPAALSDLKWAGIGAAWYWTVARSTINSLCDRGDVVGVTQLINGGQNGIGDRTTRYQQAIALGDRLLALVSTPPTDDQGDDVLSALTPDEQRELLDGVRWLKAQLGPTDPNWGADSSLGRDDAGNELTVRDGLAELKRYVEAKVSAK